MSYIRSVALGLVAALVLVVGAAAAPSSAATMSCYSQWTAKNQARLELDGWLLSYNSFKDNVQFYQFEDGYRAFNDHWWSTYYRAYIPWGPYWADEYDNYVTYLELQVAMAYDTAEQATYDYDVCAYG